MDTMGAVAKRRRWRMNPMEKVKESMSAGRQPAPGPERGSSRSFIIKGQNTLPPAGIKGKRIDEKPIVKRLF
jgi:hypothetical protein